MIDPNVLGRIANSACAVIAFERSAVALAPQRRSDPDSRYRRNWLLKTSDTKLSAGAIKVKRELAKKAAA